MWLYRMLMGLKNQESVVVTYTEEETINFSLTNAQWYSMRTDPDPGAIGAPSHSRFHTPLGSEREYD